MDNASSSARSPVCMSVFELLKAGPGPSSSHTIGPMLAGADFRKRALGLEPDLLSRARGVRIRLLGSLSATGKGHGTDRAVIAGLMGFLPDCCPPALLSELIGYEPEKRILKLRGTEIQLSFSDVEYGPIQHPHPYSNTLIIDLLDTPCPRLSSGIHRDDAPLLQKGTPILLDFNAPDPLAQNILFSFTYYSVGGGFLQWPDWKPEERGRPAHPYASFTELRARLAKTGLTIDDLMIQNEMAITGSSAISIQYKLDELLTIMKETCKRGCATEGILPGALGLPRKAAILHGRACSLQPLDSKLCLLNAYAYGVAEENASGRTIVTAPTCGASGVIPAMSMFMQEHLSLNDEAQRKGLLAATAFGFLAKHNAAIAGAEVGCQGEVGVASAMAAAMLAHARDYSPWVVENAAEIALEHHLGLTCDPVGGYVQIPCIERNAVGVVKAYNAALIACNENPQSHKVTFDDALKAMAEIGLDMNSKYKETSTGGLAVCLVDC